MKFTLSWLKVFLDTDANLDLIAETLTQIGLEVEEIKDRSSGLKDFSIAKIIKTSPHPSADKLKICEVETPTGILSIVCGASNAREGIKVVLAPEGSIIPCGGFKIKESEIRGVKSSGMLCSEEELLIGKDSQGIIEVAEDAPIGENFARYFGLDDPLIHINVTPNRADCLGVYGIARDLAAKGIGRLRDPLIKEPVAKFKSSFSLNIEEPSLCTLFAGLEIRNLQNKESPPRLQRLLKDIGIGTISAIVDVTNYICFSFGQPMHAYDSSLLDKSLSVGFAAGSLEFQALNGNAYSLEKNDPVVKFGGKNEALAGIIGGDSSACSLETKNIFLEAAIFDPVAISKTGRRLKIESDSRYRFERGVDPSFTLSALKIAAEEIISICGGEVSEILIAGSRTESREDVILPLEFLPKFIGMAPSVNEISYILERLGFKVRIFEESLGIGIPSWRKDISSKEDIAEEIARIYGYNEIPSIALPSKIFVEPFDSYFRKISGIKKIISSSGYDEVVTKSFMKSSKASLFSDLKEELSLINPISDDLDYMRPSIIPNFLDIVAKNAARSIKNLSIFEIGPIFNSRDPQGEEVFLCGLKTGSASQNPHEKIRPFDIFDIRGDLEYLFCDIGFNFDSFQIKEEFPKYYHPCSAASLNLGKNIVGYFGKIHPSLLKDFDIDSEIYAFEINLAKLPWPKNKTTGKAPDSLSDFQDSVRDFAFIIDSDKKIGEILSRARNIDKNLIKSVDLFDIYEGKSLGENKKSIAFSVTLQAMDRTLNEAEISDICRKIIADIENKFACKLRSS